MAGQLARFVREPLLHFVAIGAALFALDRALEPEAAEDPRAVIRIDGEVQARLSRLFQEGNDRLPTPSEMDAVVERYLKNETLYRKAREMRLDENDEMMRSRLMQRLSLLMYSGIEVEPPSEAVLRAWFEENRDRYTRPPTISFEVLGIDGTRAGAEALAERANGLAAAGRTLPTGEAPRVNFRNRPREQMTGFFSEDFVVAIEGLEPGIWTPVDSPRGWQVVRYVGSAPGIEPTFEEARAAASDAWRQEEIQRRARAALEALRDDFTVVREPYRPEYVALPADTGEAAQ